MGPDDLASVERSIDVGLDGAIEPLGEGPLRVEVVLRLDRQEVADGVGRSRERPSDEPLRGEAPDGDRVRGQLSRVP
jgi:hypothetical protein